MRVNYQGIWILEVAARSIGGLCGRVLTHSLGMSLEELILRQVVAEPLAPFRVARGKLGLQALRHGVPIRAVHVRLRV